MTTEPGAWLALCVGILKERNYVRTDSHDERMSDITLLRGGVLLRAGGAITSFVPNPGPYSRHRGCR